MKTILYIFIASVFLIFTSCNSAKNKKAALDHYCKISTAISHYNSAAGVFANELAPIETKIAQQDFSKEDLQVMMDTMIAADEVFLIHLDSVVNEMSAVNYLKSKTMLQENLIELFKKMRVVCKIDVKNFTHLAEKGYENKTEVNFEPIMTTVKEVIVMADSINNLQLKFQEEFKLTDAEMQSATDCANGK